LPSKIRLFLSFQVLPQIAKGINFQTPRTPNTYLTFFSEPPTLLQANIFLVLYFFHFITYLINNAKVKGIFCKLGCSRTLHAKVKEVKLTEKLALKKIKAKQLLEGICQYLNKN